MTIDNKERYKLRTYTVDFLSDQRENPQVNDLPEAVEVAQAIFKTLDADKEHSVVMALDSPGRVIGFKVVATGLVNTVPVHPREIFRAALFLNAVRIVMVHNHPSGDPTPSDNDLRGTLEMAEAGRLLGVQVVDHIVLTASGKYHSMAAGGATL